MKSRTQLPGVYRVRTGKAACRYLDPSSGERRRLPFGTGTHGFVLEVLRLGASTYSWTWVMDWDREPSKAEVATAVKTHQDRQAVKAHYEAFEPYFVTPEASA